MSEVVVSVITRESVFADTVQWITYNSRAFGYNVDIVRTSFPIDHNRNLQVDNFLRKFPSATHLFILDSDAIPRAGTVEALLALDTAVAVAPNIYYDPQHGPRLMAWQRLPVDSPRDPVFGNNREVVERTGVHRIYASGCSGVLIRRNILTSFGPPWFQFEYHENGLLAKGEDFFFFDKLEEMGYEVLAHMDYVQDHVRNVRMKFLPEWLSTQPFTAEDGGIK